MSSVVQTFIHTIPGPEYSWLKNENEIKIKVEKTWINEEKLSLSHHHQLHLKNGLDNLGT
jgi:hypothetical protein